MTQPLEIITDVDILRVPNEDASEEEAKEIIKKLEICLNSSPRPGIGLAAPQIGIHKRVAIIRIDTTRPIERIDLVNPVIVEKGDGFVNFGEGCLSIPNKVVNTMRHKELFVKDDIHPEGIVVAGITAVAVAHEVDHLYNILMTDRAVGKNKIGRNEPCPCGKKNEYGKTMKFKHCHGKQ